MAFSIHPVKIFDYVFLGNEKHATNEYTLDCFSVKAIVNVTYDVDSKFKERKEYLRISVDDKATVNLQRYFDEAAIFIDKHVQKESTVLVHCQAGVSRSPSVLLAYCIKCRGMSLSEAYEHIKSKNDNICPNMGFWRQLVDYEEHILGTKSVEMVPSPIGFIPNILQRKS